MTLYMTDFVVIPYIYDLEALSCNERIANDKSHLMFDVALFIL
jgi:hypothetical protein